MPNEVQLQNRKDWLSALRSGNFKQAKSYLYVPASGACCLGVAALVAGTPFTRGEVWDDESQDYFASDEQQVSFSFPVCWNDVANLDDIPPNEWFAARFGVTHEAAGSIQQLGTVMNDGDESNKHGRSLYGGGRDFNFIANTMELAFLIADYADGNPDCRY